MARLRPETTGLRARRERFTELDKIIFCTACDRFLRSRGQQSYDFREIQHMEAEEALDRKRRREARRRAETRLDRIAQSMGQE